MATMLKCSKCGCPNPVGYAKCYRCGTLLDPNQPRYRTVDQLSILSYVFIALAVLELAMTIIAALEVMDLASALDMPSPRKLTFFVFLNGIVITALIYTVGQVLKWMITVQDSLTAIMLSQMEISEKVSNLTTNQ